MSVNLDKNWKLNSDIEVQALLEVVDKLCRLKIGNFDPLPPTLVVFFVVFFIK